MANAASPGTLAAAQSKLVARRSSPGGWHGPHAVVEVGPNRDLRLYTPVMFKIAEDLTQMRLEVDIDEPSGRAKRAARHVHRRGYPERAFPRGWCPCASITTSSNVVTYKAILSVDNGTPLAARHDRDRDHCHRREKRRAHGPELRASVFAPKQTGPGAPPETAVWHSRAASAAFSWWTATSCAGGGQAGAPMERAPSILGGDLELGASSGRSAKRTMTAPRHSSSCEMCTRLRARRLERGCAGWARTWSSRG